MHARTWRRLAACVVCWAVAASLATPAARAQFRGSIPSQAYYVGIEQLYRGEYRDAQRTFTRALTGARKTLGPNGQIRWIDSICYHAMLGETLYQWGQPKAALEQFDFACSLFLQYPRWMLRVQFDVQPTVATNRTRTVVPWGPSQRQAVLGEFSDTYGVAQGQLDNQSVVQQGGVVQMAQVWPVNVIEVLRCTAVAIRRRNEILGPLGPYDPISKSLVTTLSRGGAPPNHWSSAWVDLERGFAHAGVGEVQQAAEYLERATLVAGRLDHPLTGMALLEQGRLALDAGDVATAGDLFAEASRSGFVYEDVGVIDEAFRWLALAHLASGAAGTQPALGAAAAWARREGYDHVAARVNLALAEELMNVGDWQSAAAALGAGEATLQDARNGLLGNFALWLEARGDFGVGRASGAEKLANALEGQAAMSLRNLQIQMANDMFDAQTLPSREAPAVYEILLSDPTPADSVMRLLETLAVMQTPHDDAFGRWLTAAVERGNMGAAIEVTDRAKRRRFHNAMPWGGRLAAVRDLLAAPTTALDPQRAQQRSGLLDRFSDFSDAAANALELRQELQKAWLPGLEDDALRRTTELWKEYAAAIDEREQQLAAIALAPAPADLTFPPLATAADLQRHLAPGQALLVFHDTPEGLLGFLFTSKSATYWDCGPSTRLGALVAQLLRDLGNFDANREVLTDVLAGDAWKKTSEKLGQALLEGSALTAATTELIVVPDGVVWYVPFEALVSPLDAAKAPLVTSTQVRYAPTVGLAFRSRGDWRRIQRTGVVIGGIVPGDKPEDRTAAAAALTAAVPGAFPLESPGPAPSPDVATLLDALVVLEDVDANGPDPLAWSPLPLDRAEQAGMLDQWLAIAGDGPQRVLLPGMHTLAERGGKPARRRGAALPGSELFYASCSLMSAGAETLLLSRWRVGGQSTLDLVREFVQELPHTPAAAAWQRAVSLIMETPIDPASEMRVKPGKGDATELTGKHPFFWAGYLVVDSGWRPAVEGENGAGLDGAPAEPELMPAEGAPGAAPAGGAANAPAGEAPAAGAPVNGPDGGAAPPKPTPPGQAAPGEPARS